LAGTNDRMPAERTRKRFFLAFLLFVLSAISFLDRTNISIAGLQISKEYGLGNQHLGWIFSAFLIGYAGFQVPAGWLASRFGPRLVIALGVVWWGVATALTTMIPAGLAQAVFLLIAIRFALGAGEAVIYPSANQFVARWVPERERGIVNGLIFAGVGAGSGLTPPLLAWFILHYGWRSAFWFSAIIGVIAGAVWWWFARDTPEEDSEVSSEELALIRAGIPEKSAAAKIPWSAMLQRADLFALVVSYFGFGYTAWIFFSWFFLYMAQVRGFNLKASAMFSMLPFLCMTFGCLGGGALSDRITRVYGLRAGRCGLAAVAYVFTAIFLVLGSRVASPQLAGVILAGGAGALYISQSSFWSVSADIAGRSSGVFSSMVNMGAQIGGAVTASLTPWVAQRYGWTMSFAIAAALALLGAALWMMVHPERPLEI
jgi:MFS transporter, ACS family, glucarate transporter